MLVRVVVVSLGFLEVHVGSDVAAIVVIVANAGAGGGSQSGVP